MKHIIIILLIALSIPSFAKLTGQARIDSLEAELPNAKADTNHVKLLSQLSFNLYYINPDKGIEYGLKGAELAHKLDWKKGGANCFNSIGINYKRKSDYPKALEYFHKALKINEQIGNKSGLAAALSNIGIIYGDQSDYPKALEYYNKALKIYEELGESAAGTIHNIGFIYMKQSDYPKALEYYFKAMEINEKPNGNKTWLANNLGSIGLIYKYQSDYPKALEFYNKALKIDEELGNKAGVAAALHNIGVEYGRQSEHDKALEYYNKALKINEELGNKNSVTINYTNIAIAYSTQKNYPPALEYYNKALKINEELGRKLGVAYNLGNLGSLYFTLSQDSVQIKPGELNQYVSLNKEINLNKSIEYYLESIKIFEEIGELNNRSKFLKFLSNAYKLKGAYRKWGEALEEHHKLKDSVFNQEKQKKIDELTSEREEIEREKEIAILEAEKKAEKEKSELITYSAIGGVVLVGIFALLIYRRLRKEKKLSNELDNKNIEIQKTHSELVEKNTEIVDSINYAKTIQSAMLPWDSTLKEHLNNYFVIYKPKDIVSGDFYWFKPLEDGYLLAVADCTGHGVPGSMISMMGSSILDEAILTQGLKDTGEILTYLNTKMIDGLNKQVSENASRDGMDICLVRVSYSESSEEYQKNKLRLQFSGAKRPLFILQNGELETIKGDKNSIAGEKYLEDTYNFTSNEIKLAKNTKIYLTSDGFVDQMGTDGKKFGTKRLKNILSENLSIQETNQKLEQEFTSHIGSEEQRDDVTIMGVEL